MRKKSIPGVADVDLPSVKLFERGVEALRDEDLLAVVLKTGYGEMNVLEASESILKHHPLSNIVSLDIHQLCKVKGISKSKAEILVCAVEMVKRGLNQGMGIAPSISCPEDGAHLVSDIKNQKKEYFVALFLNSRNQVLCRENVSIGSLNASLVHPREVFAPAIGSAAASVILAHNHPSGDPTPSREDIELTRRMVSAGEIMGIEVLDHLVIGRDRFLSMKEANLF